MEERLVLRLLIKIQDHVTLSYIGKKYQNHFQQEFISEGQEILLLLIEAEFMYLSAFGMQQVLPV